MNFQPVNPRLPSAVAAFLATAGVSLTQSARVLFDVLPPASTAFANGANRIVTPGDLNGDGTPDFVVGLPLSKNGAGDVIAFDGKTGQVLWTVTGASGAGTCSGTGADALGASLAVVGDWSVPTDGISEIAIGVPGFEVSTGPGACAALGQVLIVNGKTGAIMDVTPNPGGNSKFGSSMSASQDFDQDGVGDLLVLDSGSVVNLTLSVTRGIGGLITVALVPPPAGIAPTQLGPTMDFDGDGRREELVVSDPASNAVEVWNMVNLTVLAHLTGPANSQFGFALESRFDPSSSMDWLLVGAPNALNFAGQVSEFKNTALVHLVTGAPNQRLGRSLAWGDVDANTKDELLAGGTFAVPVQVIDPAIGAVLQTATPNLPVNPVFVQVDDVAMLGDVDGDGFQDFVVAAGAFNGSRVQVMAGGPAVVLNPSFGPGCHPTGGPIPALTTTGYSPGNQTFSVSYPVPRQFTSMILATGTPDPLGSPCGGWLAQAQVFGTLNSLRQITVNVPLSLLGLNLGTQVVVFDVSAGPLVVVMTNAIAGTIGW